MNLLTLIQLLHPTAFNNVLQSADEPLDVLEDAISELLMVLYCDDTFNGYDQVYLEQTIRDILVKKR